MNQKKARVIAYYLPQFHPIPENDKYWGKGFTEWTNVTKAKPLFHGHEQPQLPADLGFYDLRMPEARKMQAEYAEKAGIEGFCYWHYWFGNRKMALERPFEEVLKSGEPDYPFCLGWANHDWSNKTWTKNKTFAKDTIIFKQEYPGEEDYIDHFNYLLPAFKDHRYITVDGMPLFTIFQPDEIPDVRKFIALWQRLAKENGLLGIYFVARVMLAKTVNPIEFKNVENTIWPLYKTYLDKGFSAVNPVTLKYAQIKSKGLLDKAIKSISRRFFRSVILDKYRYEDIVNNMYTEEDRRVEVIPQLIPRRDRSPRAGRKAEIYYGSTPEKFGDAIDLVLSYLTEKDDEHKIIFLNAWNEWGEGAYLEPDQKYGIKYIEVLADKLS